MLQTSPPLRVNPTWNGRRYEVLAWANDQELIHYEEFGAYHGEWILISRDNEKYYIWKGWYGSCQGCDHFESKIGHSPELTKAEAKDFASQYPPFLEIPRVTCLQKVESQGLLEYLPRNTRDEISEADLGNVAADAGLNIKLIEELQIQASDITSCRNQEIKQKALKVFGYDKFAEAVGAEVLHEDGEDRLIRINGDRDLVFVSVKDSSTDRRYLLRVPPNMKRTREAIAWTFNMQEKEYNPTQEA